MVEAEDVTPDQAGFVAVDAEGFGAAIIEAGIGMKRQAIHGLQHEIGAAGVAAAFIDEIDLAEGVLVEHGLIDQETRADDRIAWPQAHFAGKHVA